MSFSRIRTLIQQEYLGLWWGMSGFVVLYSVAQAGQPNRAYFLLIGSAILHAVKVSGYRVRRCLERVRRRFRRDCTLDGQPNGPAGRRELVDYFIVGELYLLVLFCLYLSYVWPAYLAPFILSAGTIAVAVYIYLGRFFEDEDAR